MWHVLAHGRALACTHDPAYPRLAASLHTSHPACCGSALTAIINPVLGDTVHTPGSRGNAPFFRANCHESPIDLVIPIVGYWEVVVFTSENAMFDTRMADAGSIFTQPNYQTTRVTYY